MNKFEPPKNTGVLDRMRQFLASADGAQEPEEARVRVVDLDEVRTREDEESDLDVRINILGGLYEAAEESGESGPD